MGEVRAGEAGAGERQDKGSSGSSTGEGMELERGKERREGGETGSTPWMAASDRSRSSGEFTRAGGEEQATADGEGGEREGGNSAESSGRKGTVKLPEERDKSERWAEMPRRDLLGVREDEAEEWAGEDVDCLRGRRRRV